MQDTANGFSAAVCYLRTVAQERWLCPEELFFLLYSDPSSVSHELIKQSTDIRPDGVWSDGSSKYVPKLLPSSKPLSLQSARSLFLTPMSYCCIDGHLVIYTNKSDIKNDGVEYVKYVSSFFELQSVGCEQSSFVGLLQEKGSRSGYSRNVPGYITEPRGREGHRSRGILPFGE
jgi:hypothetical protein